MSIKTAYQNVKGYVNRKLPFDCTKIADYQGNFADIDGYNSRIAASARPIGGKSRFFKKLGEMAGEFMLSSPRCSRFLEKSRPKEQSDWSPQAMEEARKPIDPQSKDFFQNAFTNLFYLFTDVELNSLNDVSSASDMLKGDLLVCTFGRPYKKEEFQKFAVSMRHEILSEENPQAQKELMQKFRIFLSVLAENCSEPANYVQR